MRDRDALLTLLSELENDGAALRKVAGRLNVTPDDLRRLPSADPSVAAAAFEVHNYYSISENLMRRLATAFENALDPSEWHKQLLARMAMDIEGVRPALIDPALRSQLDALRKFRYFFRNAYDRPLDPAKVADVLAILSALEAPWMAAVRRFAAWIEALATKL